MTPDTVFQASNGVAMLLWVCLVVAPRSALTQKVVHSGAGSVAFGVLYLCLLVFMPAPEQEGNFGSLSGVSALFSSPWVLCAGWVHYLAFDLFVGSWMCRDAERLNVRHLWIVPSLLATFWLGPIGLLSYVLLFRLRRRD